MKPDKSMTPEQFNYLCPKGTPVYYWPKPSENRFIETTILSDAWRLGHGDVVVKVEGVSGGVAITHLVVPDEKTAPVARAMADIEADATPQPLPATIEVKGIKIQLPAGTRTGEVSDGYHTFDDLYAHRCRLFVTLMRLQTYRAFWSHRHSDGSTYEGWILAGIMTQAGWVTYHLPESEIANLTMVRELERAPEWDGHTSDDVLERLLTLG